MNVYFSLSFPPFGSGAQPLFFVMRGVVLFNILQHFERVELLVELVELVRVLVVVELVELVRVLVVPVVFCSSSRCSSAFVTQVFPSARMSTNVNFSPFIRGNCLFNSKVSKN